MKLLPTAIPDVVLVEPRVFADDRGHFFEIFHAGKFADDGLALTFVQLNQSRSRRATVRGLHYQVERPQGKLVRCVRGAVWDVAVDLRRSSPTFGRWVGELLSAENARQLWIPPGFAHGFVALEDESDVTYACTEVWLPEHDRTLRWDDPTIAVRWPLDGLGAPILSAKDLAAPTLDTAETYP
jgi:dTDP-4-dehydrorhamnose 3,5-epimerase